MKSTKISSIKTCPMDISRDLSYNNPLRFFHTTDKYAVPNIKRIVMDAQRDINNVKTIIIPADIKGKPILYEFGGMDKFSFGLAMIVGSIRGDIVNNTAIKFLRNAKPNGRHANCHVDPGMLVSMACSNKGKTEIVVFRISELVSMEDVGIDGKAYPRNCAAVLNYAGSVTLLSWKGNVGKMHIPSEEEDDESSIIKMASAVSTKVRIKNNVRSMYMNPWIPVYKDMYLKQMVFDSYDQPDKIVNEIKAFSAQSVVEDTCSNIIDRHYVPVKQVITKKDDKYEISIFVFSEPKFVEGSEDEIDFGASILVTSYKIIVGKNTWFPSNSFLLCNAESYDEFANKVGDETVENNFIYKGC